MFSKKVIIFYLLSFFMLIFSIYIFVPLVSRVLAKIVSNVRNNHPSALIYNNNNIITHIQKCNKHYNIYSIYSKKIESLLISKK